MKYKQEILKLREEGKTYNQIREITGCSKGTIGFHCGKGQKEKQRDRVRKYRKLSHPYTKKLQDFKKEDNRSKHIKVNSIKQIRLLYFKTKHFFRDKKTREYNMQPTFTVEDIINKFGESPICYLTGRPIDINMSRTYAFDHILPRSRGGKNTIENLGLCTKEINQAKYDRTVEEFLELCKDVLIHNGFDIIKRKI